MVTCQGTPTAPLPWQPTDGRLQVDDTIPAELRLQVPTRQGPPVEHFLNEALTQQIFTLLSTTHYWTRAAHLFVCVCVCVCV